MKTNSGWCSDSVWAVPSEANSLYEFMRCGQGWKCKDFPPRLLQLYRNTLFKRTFSQENFKIYKVLKLYQDAAGDSLEILLVLQSPGSEVLVPVILSDPSPARYQTSLIVADEDALPSLTVLRWPLSCRGLVRIVFLCLSPRHNVTGFSFLALWLLFFRSVNNLDAEGLSLLSREEQRIRTKHTNGNLTANCFNSQNENQPPHCRLNGFSAALKTRPRASSLLWADPSQTATRTQPLLRISSEGAKIKRALFCCYCVCRVALDITFIEAKHSHKQSAAERNWILISVSGQFLFALLSDVMRNVRRPAAAVQRQRFSEMFIMFGVFFASTNPNGSVSL